MKSVGIRELKNKLSDYVRQVRSGETILVTDRGEVVAEINPPGQATDRSVPHGLAEMARRGLVTLGTNERANHRRGGSLMRKEEVAELLDAVRGPR